MTMLYAPAVWLAHFSAVYVLLSLVCASDAAGRTLLGVGIVPFGVALASAVALALIAVIAWGSRAGSRGARRAPEAFPARASLPLCGVSALAVAWVAYPAFVLPPCVG